MIETHCARDGTARPLGGGKKKPEECGRGPGDGMLMRNRIYSEDEMMWGMEIGKRLAERRMRNAADFTEGYSVYIGMASALYCRKASIIVKLTLTPALALTEPIRPNRE